MYQVLAFYGQQGMGLPTKPPLLLVEPSAMEGAEVREKREHASHSHPTAPVSLNPQSCNITEIWN